LKADPRRIERRPSPCGVITWLQSNAFCRVIGAGVARKVALLSISYSRNGDCNREIANFFKVVLF
jgi:hypothetical protein